VRRPAAATPEQADDASPARTDAPIALIRPGRAALGSSEGRRALLAAGWRDVVAVLPQWATARVIVLGALGMAHVLVDHTHPSRAVASRVRDGLLGWDAGWYEAIARFGYGPLGHQSLRFFPLFPLAGRFLGVLPGVRDGGALVVLANVCALVATVLLFVLARRESGDEALARRATWLLSVVPAAFTLVMGYAEAMLLLWSVGCVLALRRGSTLLGPRGAPAWWWAAGLGFLAGLTRPLGALLAVPAVVEAVRARQSRAGSSSPVGPGGRVVGPAAAILGPVVGMAVFLGWSWVAEGSPWLPLRVQAQAGHHGGFSDPVATVLHDARGVFHHHLGTALHVPWVLLVLALLVVCWRRWPACYGALATADVLVALSGTNLDSFERYALSAFPLVLAGATLTSGPRVERVVLVLAGAGLAGYALLAFTNVVVP